jgi:hypothetical protein
MKKVTQKEMNKVDKAFVRGKEQGRFDLALEIEWGQTTAREELAKQMEDEEVPSLGKAYRRVNKLKSEGK